MDWRDRFRAGQVLGAAIARRNPGRGLVLSDRDGNEEAYAWDADTGELRRLTDGHRVLEATVSPDGASIVYLHDETGSELGHLRRVPFEGGEATDLTPDLEPYAAYGVKATTDRRGGLGRHRGSAPAGDRGWRGPLAGRSAR